jgi:hypothetical protein
MVTIKTDIKYSCELTGALTDYGEEEIGTNNWKTWSYILKLTMHISAGPAISFSIISLGKTYTHLHQRPQKQIHGNVIHND